MRFNPCSGICAGRAHFVCVHFADPPPLLCFPLFVSHREGKGPLWSRRGRAQGQESPPNQRNKPTKQTNKTTLPLCAAPRRDAGLGPKQTKKPSVSVSAHRALAPVPNLGHPFLPPTIHFRVSFGFLAARPRPTPSTTTTPPTSRGADPSALSGASLPPSRAALRPLEGPDQPPEATSRLLVRPPRGGTTRAHAARSPPTVHPGYFSPHPKNHQVPSQGGGFGGTLRAAPAAAPGPGEGPTRPV